MKFSSNDFYQLTKIVLMIGALILAVLWGLKILQKLDEIIYFL